MIISGSLDHIMLKKVWHVVFKKPYYGVQNEHPAWNISERIMQNTGALI